MPGPPPQDDDELLGLCQRAVDAVAAALERLDDLSLPGERPGQYALDLVADRAVLDVLLPAGLGVLSEESGLHVPDAPLVAVVDPVDGSTNASRGLPWYAGSICVVDAEGPRVGLVVNLPQRIVYSAIRGQGARRDGVAIAPSSCTELRQAVVNLAGFPSRHLGWAQFRSYGAAALDLCAVAEGTVDGFVVGAHGSLAPWDYMGALLVCLEAGAHIADLDGRSLVVVDEHRARRAVVAAATEPLLEQLSAKSRGDGGSAEGSHERATPPAVER